jgi:hypothetical protein
MDGDIPPKDHATPDDAFGFRARFRGSANAGPMAFCEMERRALKADCLISSGMRKMLRRLGLSAAKRKTPGRGSIGSNLNSRGKAQ